MAINQKLTDKNELLEAADGDKLHIIDVSDTSQSAEGSSKWIAKSNLGASSYLGLSDTEDTTFEEKEGFVPMVISDLTTDPATKTLKLQPIPTYSDLYGGNAVIKGGVSNTTGLTYNVWSSSFLVNNTLYSDLISGDVTLSDGDATHPRIDIFVIEVTDAEPPVSSVTVIEGTPSATPVKPTVNLTSQVEVSFVTIPAGATSDGNISTEKIYDESVGEPTEWDVTDTPTGADLVYTTDPKVGTYCISLPAYSTDVLQYTKASTIDYDAENKLLFYLKIPSGTTPSSRIQFKLKNGSDFFNFSSTIGGLYNYGFSDRLTTWQLVSIPLSVFASSSRTLTAYDVFEMTFTDTPALFLDWIGVQGGAPSDDDLSIYALKTSLLGYKETGKNSDGDKIVSIGDVEDEENGFKLVVDQDDLSVTAEGGTLKSLRMELDADFKFNLGSGFFSRMQSSNTANRTYDMPNWDGDVLVSASWTVAALPTGVVGQRGLVYDSDTTLKLGIGDIPVGGGSNVVPVFFNGVNWLIG